MAKKHRRKKKEPKIVFPNYVFRSGELAGRDVRSVIAEGMDGLSLLTDYMSYDSPDEGRTYACTASVIYEMGHAIDKLIKDCEGDYMSLLIEINELTCAIGWYPNIVYVSARDLGYRNAWDFLISDDEMDMYKALQNIRMFMKEIYMADPLDVDLEFRCQYCKKNNGSLD